MKIAFLHRPSYFLNALTERLRERLADHEFVLWTAGEAAPARDVEVLLAVGTLQREQIEDQPKLFFVQTTSAGYDGIDVDAATDLGIWVSAAPSGETGNAVSVAEWGVFLMLGAARRLPQALDSLRDPDVPTTHINAALSGKTVCIVGLGAIGKQLIERLRPFGVRFTGVDVDPENAPGGVTAYPTAKLHDAIADADFIVVCAPGSKENENLIGARTISAMKRGAFVINVSRGTLIDEDALMTAITNGHLAGAGLDVVKKEPVEPSNLLLHASHVLLTPHIAGATDVMLEGTVDYIGSVIDGLAADRLPQSLINAPKQPRKALGKVPA